MVNHIHAFIASWGSEFSHWPLSELGSLLSFALILVVSSEENQAVFGW
jgi:hypothetical protein